LADESGSAPIIVIRKKKGYADQHRGAWKVAYADFVTALMALFIVLWLMSTSEEVRKAVGGYFQDPTGKGKLEGSVLAGSRLPGKSSKEDMNQLKEKIDQMMQTLPNFLEIKDQIQIMITAEGLRIELIETDKGMFFQSGSPTPSAIGSELLKKLAAQLGKLPNTVLLEGHTDAKPFTASQNYGNWELSTDRANAARRLMQASGLGQSQVAQVRGFADQKPRKADEPSDASNRRISLIVQNLTPSSAAVGPTPEPQRTPPSPR
jgi:chemotaxis protein MotB